jgi:hypothetical protein
LLLPSGVVAGLSSGLKQLVLLAAEVGAPVVILLNFHQYHSFLVLIRTHNTLHSVLTLAAQNIVSFLLEHFFVLASLHLLLNFGIFLHPLSLDTVNTLSGVVFHVDAHLLDVLFSLFKLSTLLFRFTLLFTFKNHSFPFSLCRLFVVLLLSLVFK